MRFSTIASAVFVFGATCIEASPAKNPAALLKTAAFPRYFGAALGLGHLTNSSDPQFRSIAAAGKFTHILMYLASSITSYSEFDGATPENEMKWRVN